MSRKAVKILSLSVLMLLISATLSPTASANSAEPPVLTIIVSFPPDDLSLSIHFADGSVIAAVKLQKEQKAWETYYRVFYGMLKSTDPSFEGATLVVKTGENEFECIMPESSFSRHNNLLTLDVGKQSITEGQTTARQIALISMRVILTLLIEGLIFYGFEYRKKASWIAFVVINLITQGVLNFLITGPNLGSYWFVGYVFFELIIFIVEMTAFALILREHKRSRAVIYALSANFASLVLGGVLISFLPF